MQDSSAENYMGKIGSQFKYANRRTPIEKSEEADDLTLAAPL